MAQPTQSTSPPRRALALDALRGFAILTMVLSGVIPYGPATPLPAWMYHAQVPPPLHKFNGDLPGMTWVDLVFPFFIFSMGAAFPLAFTKRLEKGGTVRGILLSIAERGFLLGSFAIVIAHIRPYTMQDSPTTATWLIALLAFVLFFPMYGRFPWPMKPWISWLIRAIGWGGMLVLLSRLVFPDGTGFSKGRSDIIIVILTNIAVFGSLVWLVTRKSLLLRLGSLGLIMGMRLAGQSPGWVTHFWNNPYMNWILLVGTMSYLFIAIPGSIAGDQLLQWMSAAGKEEGKGNWTRGRLGLQALLMGAFLILLLVGMQTRYVFLTVVLSAMLGAAGIPLFARPGNSTEKLLSQFFQWGLYWLFLGLVFDPYEGGVKKDPATMSYFFITAGLANFMLIAFTVLIDVFRRPKWLLGLLVNNGQNPMIAYAAESNLIGPILHLTGIIVVMEKITPGPWPGAFRGLVITLLGAICVSFFTRKKIFWRT